MCFRTIVAGFISALASLACCCPIAAPLQGPPAGQQPAAAQAKPTGQVRSDDYYWLKPGQTPDAIDRYIVDTWDEVFQKGELAKDLLDDYAGNTIAADKRWKGHRWQITGRVLKVDQSVFGRPYIALTDSNKFRIISARCNMADPAGVEGLRPNDGITVWGKVTSGGGLGVTVDDCYLITDGFKAKVQKRSEEIKSLQDGSPPAKAKRSK